jgi:hypothetical protein
MLMKTYKYSHQKICKTDVQETQAKEIKPTPPAQPTPPAHPAPPQPPKQPTEKAELAVTFAHSHLNQWNELRQQRQLIRQHRVKSLISQAI